MEKKVEQTSTSVITKNDNNNTQTEISVLPDNDTSTVEKAIDRMVYKLYDLSYAEVKVIAP